MLRRVQLLLFIFFHAVLKINAQQSAFYDSTVIQKIEIWFNQPGWDYMLDTARSGKDGRLMASWVKINNVQFDSVGVKYKGSSSYDSTFAKNPLNIELNSYKEQNYQGFRDIKLNNGYADPSMIREVLAYEIARLYMDAPQANFAQVYINGNYMGLYTNAESINKQFAAHHFFSAGGIFIKCNPFLTPSPSVKSNLKYIVGSDSSAYFNYYEMKSDYGWNHLKSLCDSVSNFSSSAETNIDMNKVCRMLAFNNLLVNLDSYSGAFSQNYYLYRDATGLFNPVIWDLNMSFGGFPFSGNSNTSLGNLSITGMQNMSVSLHSTDDYWPLIKLVFGNSMYKKMYMAYLRTMLNEVFVSGFYLTRYNYYYNLIAQAVQSDPKKFFSNDQFQNALTANVSVGSYSVPGIQTLMSKRITYLQSVSDLTVSAPVISSVQAKSDSPGFSSTLAVSAQLSNANSGNVFLHYRYSKTGRFAKTVLHDDGMHADGGATDGIYGTVINLNGNEVQYYIYAENAAAASFAPARASYEFYTYRVYNAPSAGEVTINEFLADNKSDVKNEYHLNEDWIELFNNSNKTISLAGLCISDDNFEHSKFAFSSTALIQPNSFVTLWADNILKPGAAQVHCNFKLNNNGGGLWLSDGGYVIHDAVSYAVQEEDVSLGRCGDGTGPFRSFKYPTFGMSNCVVGLPDEGNENEPVLFPNPCSSGFKVRSNSYSVSSITLLDINGKEIIKESFINETFISTAQLTPGFYVVKCNNRVAKLIVNH